MHDIFRFSSKNNKKPFCHIEKSCTFANVKQTAINHYLNKIQNKNKMSIQGQKNLLSLINSGAITSFLSITALLILLLQPSSLSGQEYIKDVDYVKSDTSIVREIDDTYRLVYNVGYYAPSFSMYDDVGSSSTDLYLPDDVRVLDFFIKDDIVYFCGYKWMTSGVPRAIFGYFDLNNFPLSQVYYYRHDDYISFDKLDRYTVLTNTESEFHLVFAASISAKQSTIVDSYELPNNVWLFESMPVYDSVLGHKVTDISVTPNYVVVTSYESNLSVNRGYVWSLARPNYLGGNIFSVGINRFTLPVVSATPAVIERCTNNWYVVAYCAMPYSSLIVVPFDGIFYYFSLEVQESEAMKTPVDIKYNATDKELDILVAYQEKLTPQYLVSRLYHFPQTLYPAGGPVDLHYLPKERIVSLDHLNSSAGMYIGSGYNVNNKILSLYRYKYDVWTGCFGNKILESRKVVWDKKFYQQMIEEPLSRHFYRQQFETTNSESTISTRCQNDRREQ